jgi:predicted GTPase
MAPRTLVICGAGGRDFHEFNVRYRDDPSVRVAAFTAAQIPDIDDRRYPPVLAGPHHPDGIPIVPEGELEALCAREGVDEVVFAYSDVPHEHVMHLASRALGTGADFSAPGPARSQLRAARPVVAVTAVRTGCGKSQLARHLSRGLGEDGLRVVALRHPMPYGDLARQRVQRFASPEDIDRADCTLEEREEYEPHVAAGNVVYAGVDYGAILARAEAEADLFLWDGGNNDFSFLAPDLHLVVVDALRPEHVRGWHPGEAVLRRADLVVVNKVDAARPEAVAALRRDLAGLVPGVPVHLAASPVVLDDPDAVRGRRVLVVDDGPTLTHGGMPWGAGYVAVRALGDATFVDPRASAVPLVRDVYARFPHLGQVLPAFGYGAAQRDALAATIDGSDAEVVVAGTPIDFARAVPVRKPVVRARYAYRSVDGEDLLDVVRARGRAEGWL